MNTTIIVAIITACSAIIPQIAITIIKNHYDLKLKKIEMYEQAKREALNNFISSATICSLNSNEPNSSQLHNLYESVYTILAYFPEADEILSEFELKYIYSHKNDHDIDRLSKATLRTIVIKLTKLLSEKY
mgnify:CR=1 FL=1